MPFVFGVSVSAQPSNQLSRPSLYEGGSSKGGTGSDSNSSGGDSGSNGAYWLWVLFLAREDGYGLRSLLKEEQKWRAEDAGETCL